MRDVCVWEPSGGRLRVVIPAGLVRRMRANALRAAASGQDTGGIMLGRMGSERGVRTILVDAVEPLAWPHGVAPAERGEVDEALEIHAGRVVGYVRNHRSEGIFLHAGDLVLIKSAFPRESVFLLVKRAGEDAVSTRLSFWQDGVIAGENGEPEFPFGRPMREAPPSASSAPRRGFAVAAACCAVAAGLTAASFYVHPDVRAAGPAPPAVAGTPAPRLGLQLERRAGDVVITWEAANSPVQSARRGALTMRDGGQHRSFELDATQLRTGRAYYTPLTADVQIRLEVYDEVDRPFAESVRLLAGPALDATAAPAASEDVEIGRA